AFGLTEPAFQGKGPGPAQAHFYSVSAHKGGAASRRSDVVHTQLPSVPIPARIEAESFAAMEGAQTEACGDDGGGLNLGFFDPGDFLEYSIRVEEPGDYSIDYRLASESGSEGFEVLVGERTIDKQSVPATGGWQLYITQTSPKFRLEPGDYTLRFRSNGNQWNINWFEIKR
ncbi:MAG: carbohydrate-binding protein, partial [Planctomycetota bacterium]